MTIEWSVIAGLLYTEIAVTILLLVPWIKPKIWRTIFKSRIGHAIGQYAMQAALIVGALLFMLFVDALRLTRKYSLINDQMQGTGTAAADAVVRREMREMSTSPDSPFYFSLLFRKNSSYLHHQNQMQNRSRIVKIIHRMSDFESSAESALREAHATSKSVTESQGESEKQKVFKRELEGELSSTRTERDNLLNQSKVLQKEYDELLTKLNKLQT